MAAVLLYLFRTVIEIPYIPPGLNMDIISHNHAFELIYSLLLSIII